ncbi:MAG: hypothetical protein KatS3mg104_3243 [Phycisphaerae bacterium]|nr:MAG: hypothetical protein KatS3mg104_3243 [Phycisphaerae bacterium]
MAVNLATALAQAGKKTLLVDMDFQAVHDMARMLNLTPRHCIVQILPELEKDASPYLIKKFALTHQCGLDFIPAILHAKQAGHITSETIKPFFKRATQAYDFIIIDGGKAFSETIVSVFDHSNLIFLVATPDILAVYQLKWTLEMLQSLHFPLKMIKVILNRAESRGGVAWQEVRSALNCEIFALIPSDGKTVGMALNRGVPCVIDNPKAKVSEAFVKMAAELMQRQDIYVQPAVEVLEVKRREVLPGTDDYWTKVGVAPDVPSGAAVAAVKEEDEVVALKKRIHEKLVARLHVEELTAEVLGDPAKAAELRRSAEKIVSNLLLEEKGAMIASHEERARLVREIIDDALGLGPLEDLLKDPEITDIMVNRRDEIYIEKNGRLILTNKKFLSDQHMRTIIDRIIAPLGRRVDESIPMVDARLPDGSRFNAIIPPLALNGPALTIRKFGVERLSLDELLNKYHTLDEAMRDFLNACVIGRRNIVISGGTGAGKTTLLNMISQFIPDNERIITIEDAAELRLKKSHLVASGKPNRPMSRARGK